MNNYNSIKLNSSKVVKINTELETVTRLLGRYIKEEDNLPPILKEVDRESIYKQLLKIKKSLNLLITKDI